MLDVLPPRGFDNNAFNHAKKRNVRASPSSHVVHIDWKLPARLRRPVREQLKKEKRVRFSRRSITTRPVFGPDNAASTVQLPRGRVFNHGAEYHTGDMYKGVLPKLHAAAPPYTGHAASRAVVELDAGSSWVSEKPSRLPKRSEKKQIAPVYREQNVLTYDYAASRAAAPLNLPKQSEAKRAAPVYKEQNDYAAPLLSREDQVQEKPSRLPKRSETRRVAPVRRDQSMPTYDYVEYDQQHVNQDDKVDQRDTVSLTDEVFDFHEEIYDDMRVDQPSHALSLPFRIQVWPYCKNLFSRQHVFNLAILFVGFAISVFIIWNLQGAGRGFAVLSSVQSQSRMAFEEIMTAQAALAETDFASSEQSFAQAESILRDAREELTVALAASRHALRIIDVTGTVRSGEEMLKAGESLTRAGQYVSKGIAPLLAASDETAEYTLVEAISIMQEEFGYAVVELDKVEESLDQVDSSFIPDDLALDIEVLRSSVPRAKELLATVYDEGDALLYLLGAQRDREYLILFANNNEIRPVGGFIGTFGLVNMDRGRVESIDVNSVYDPDGQLQEFIAPPDPLLSITHRWYMRDANWFVDYEVSARKIADFFEKEGGPTVDGVILMTPDVIKRLLRVTGPIEVPGYDVTVSEDNFVEVTQSQVTYSYDRELNRPKQFLTDLTPILLNRLFVGNTAGKLQILSALTSSLQYKELLLYFRDEEAQQRLKDYGWAGAYPDNAQGFLSVNNANVGGHKSDQFIEQEIDYRVEIKKDGSVEAVVTIRRTHNGPEEATDYLYPESEDPARKDNIVYQRVLIPKGAQLVEARGFSSSADVPSMVIEKTNAPLVADPDVALWQSVQTKHKSGTTIGLEAGYSFFANWIVTKPGETSVVLYRYRLPGYVQLPAFFDAAQSYSLYIAKQPGAIRTQIRAQLTLPDQFRIVHTVPSDGVTQNSSNVLVYRGALQKDVLAGGVFEKGQ